LTELNTWYEEFELKARRPRIPAVEVKNKLRNVEEENIYLKEMNGCTEIVIRLKTPGIVFPTDVENVLKQSGLTLERAFEDVLSQKLDASRITTRVLLARPAIRAYREAWIRLIDTAYVGHFHPTADTLIRKEIDTEILPTLRQLAHKGRWKSHPNADADLQRRYSDWLPKCNLIHEIATKQVARVRNVSTRRKAIWDQIRAEIHGMPGDNAIMGGDAFRKIRRGASLQEPSTWSPNQLAISLISIEVSRAYQTIEKKIRRMKRSGKAT
jgi:hypothetical protein